MIDLKKAFNEPFRTEGSWRKIGIFYGINVGFYVSLMIIAIIGLIGLVSAGFDINSLLPASCESGECPLSNTEVFSPLYIPFIIAVMIFSVYITGYYLDFMKNIMDSKDSIYPCFLGNTKRFFVRGAKAFSLSFIWFVALMLIALLSAVVFPPLVIVSFTFGFFVFWVFVAYGQMAIAYGLSFKKALNVKLIFNMFSKTWQSFLVFMGITVLYYILSAIISAMGLGLLFSFIGLIVPFISFSIFAYIFLEALEKSEGEIV